MTSTTLRKWGLRLGIPIAVLAALVVAGPFIYIHFVNNDAPPAFSLPAANSATTEAPTAAAPSTAAVDGTWTVASGSQAGYRVKEVLFGQDTTAVGRTDDVSGQIVISGTTVKSAKLTVDLTTVTSNESRRDSQFNGRIMNTSTYPTATFSLTKAITLESLPANGVVTKVDATGDLTLRGTTKAVTAALSAQRDGDTIHVQGAIPVTFADFGIANPSMPGITVQDTGTIEFLVLFTQL